MRKIRWLPAAISFSVLAACGGGGGGVNSTPTPPPPVSNPPAPAPPPPTGNTSIGELIQSESFSTDSATTTVAFDLTSKTTINGAASAGTLSISYDAGTKSYTVTAPGRSQTFGQSDRITSEIPGEAVYRKTNEPTYDRLTLVTQPYTGTVPNKYVGMGYWQRNVFSGNRQDTLFDTFTYGFSTPAAGIPRSGFGSFNIDVFGLSATPGFEPRVFQGRGTFDTDFMAGVFSTNTYLTETELLTGKGISGGGIQLTGAGHISSSGNSFSGSIVYGGAHGAVAGSLLGRFYGPGAQELGASFTAGNKDGSTVTGSMTGQRAQNNPAVNQTLTNLVTPQLFYTQEALLTVNGFDGEDRIDARLMKMVAQLNLRTNDNLSYAPGLSILPGGDFTTTSLVPSANPNFVAYEKTFNGQPVRLELYRAGNSNTELSLTYSSFGRWSSSSKNGVVTETSRVFFAYGLETPAGLLSARTGSARYTGVVYGAGANAETKARYDVSGTSRFDVDFSSQSYSGALALKGTSTNGAGNIDFGNYDFSGKIFSTTRQSVAALSQNGKVSGELTSTFFGPGGEEIGGPFTLMVQQGNPGAGTAIAGVTVAKRQ